MQFLIIDIILKLIPLLATLLIKKVDLKVKICLFTLLFDLYLPHRMMLILLLNKRFTKLLGMKCWNMLLKGKASKGDSQNKLLFKGPFQTISQTCLSKSQ